MAQPQLHWQKSNSLAPAAQLLARATQIAAGSPLSDQAIIAAQRGQRELLLFSETSALEPVAIGLVGQGELDLVVDPPARGRGVGKVALAVLLALPAATGDSALAGTLRAWVHGENPAANALLRGAGFQPARTLHKMHLHPQRLPSVTDWQLPEQLRSSGFQLRTFTPQDAAAWVQCNAAAFADHPEQGKITLADFALLQQASWFDPQDLLLLEVDDTLAGYTWVKTLRDTSNSCELYAIGLSPEYAGRGIGRVLLEATLQRMAAHRALEVSLHVEGNNAHAIELYARAGFTLTTQSTQWCKSS